jgi:hypothetical protein
VDRRYTDTRWHAYHPTNGSDQDYLSYTLPAWTNGNVFDLSQLTIVVKIRLEDSTGNKPKKSSQVGMSGGLFSSTTGAI